MTTGVNRIESSIYLANVQISSPTISDNQLDWLLTELIATERSKSKIVCSLDSSKFHPVSVPLAQISKKSLSNQNSRESSTSDVDSPLFPFQDQFIVIFSLNISNCGIWIPLQERIDSVDYLKTSALYNSANCQISLELSLGPNSISIKTNIGKIIDTKVALVNINNETLDVHNDPNWKFIVSPFDTEFDLSVNYASFVPFNVAKDARFYPDKETPVCIISKRSPVKIHSPAQQISLKTKLRESNPLLNKIITCRNTCFPFWSNIGIGRSTGSICR